MKLSDAIRKGCEGTYQVFGIGWDGGKGYCAWGAAQQGIKRDSTIWRKFLDMTVENRCFVCNESLNSSGYIEETINLAYMIIHLNDYHGMSREAIAEWVETIENKMAMETTPKAVEAVESPVIKSNEVMEKVEV